MSSQKTKKPALRPVTTNVSAETVDGLAMEAARLTRTHGQIVSVSAVIRIALTTYLARASRVQRVARPVATQVEA